MKEEASVSADEDDSAFDDSSITVDIEHSIGSGKSLLSTHILLILALVLPEGSEFVKR